MEKISESCFCSFRCSVEIEVDVLLDGESITSGASSDIASATQIATRMVTQYGFSDAIGKVKVDDEKSVSPETKSLVDREVKRLIEEAHDRTIKLLEEKRVELDRLAMALVEYETLDLEETMRVIKGEVLVGKRKELERIAKMENGNGSGGEGRKKGKGIGGKGRQEEGEETVVGPTQEARERDDRRR
jgi:hypothetical protein